MALPQAKGSLIFGHNILNKAFQELPRFLKETDYRFPDQPLDTSFHRAFNTKEQFFYFLQKDPESMQNLHASLGAFDSPIHWTAVLPLEKMLHGSDDNTVLLIDIGGGPGFHCAEFRQRITGRFPGRVINQDLPHTLATAPKHKGVEMMVQDFYDENQVQGMHAYNADSLLRQVVHCPFQAHGFTSFADVCTICRTARRNRSCNAFAMPWRLILTY